MILDSLILLLCVSSVYNHVSCCIYWHCIHEFLDLLNLVPCSWHVLIQSVMRSIRVNVCVTSWGWRPVVPACTARNESDWLVLRSSPTSNRATHNRISSTLLCCCCCCNTRHGFLQHQTSQGGRRARVCRSLYGESRHLDGSCACPG